MAATTRSLVSVTAILDIWVSTNHVERHDIIPYFSLSEKMEDMKYCRAIYQDIIFIFCYSEYRKTSLHWILKKFESGYARAIECETSKILKFNIFFLEHYIVYLGYSRSTPYSIEFLSTCWKVYVLNSILHYLNFSPPDQRLYDAILFFSTGTECDLVDYCDNNPCKNGGTCSSKTNTYSCTCQDGWIGDACTTDFDECSHSPRLCQVTSRTIPSFAYFLPA